MVEVAIPPFALLALIVHVALLVAGNTTVGVPVIAPVEVLRLRPLGSCGDTVKDMAPVNGVTVVVN